MRLGVLIDTSNSVAHSSLYAPAVQGVTDFLNESLTGPQDKAFFVSFSALPYGTRFLTRAEVTSLKLNFSTGGGTALYDALQRACLERMKSDPAPPARRVLLVLSDGDDNLSHVDRNAAIAAAQVAGAVVFALDLGGASSNDKGRKTLEQITNETGGHVFAASGKKDVAKAFANLRAQLDNMFDVTFVPTESAKSGERRAIELEDGTDHKLKIWAPKAYYSN